MLFLQIFPGNINAKDMLKMNLNQPVLALFVRFVPKEWHSWPCMRVEVYGKPASKSINHIRVTLCLCFKMSLCAKTFHISLIYMKMNMKAEHIFRWMVSQRDSFWKGGESQPGSGLYHCRLQRLRFFWSAPRIKTSGLVWNSAIHGFSVKSDKSETLHILRKSGHRCWSIEARPLETKMARKKISTV